MTGAPHDLPTLRKKINPEGQEMTPLQEATWMLAEACQGDPVKTTFVVCTFYFMFNILEWSVEKVIFGKSFAHWLDPIFCACFIAYAAYAVYWCAIMNFGKR